MLQFHRRFYLYTDRYESKITIKEEDDNQEKPVEAPVVDNEEDNLETTGSLI